MSLQVSKETGVVYDPVFLKILEDSWWSDFKD